MGYVALYRKYRPLVFEDMVGQEHIVRALKNSVITGRISHAYLLCGTRGTGKTTTAKIFARAINCLNPQNGDPCNKCEVCRGALDGTLTDIVEIDAASNNSVDNVREIREEVVYLPTLAKYKVYIIDEVHMLSAGAFNALLKTLEEPPGHVVFLLATTEPHKLPATILSRCLRFDFKRIGTAEIVGRLRKIADDINLKIDDDSLLMIANAAEGAMRDALSLLDQCIPGDGSPVTSEYVAQMLGLVGNDILFEIAEAVQNGNMTETLHLVDRVVMSGTDLHRFVSDMVLFYRDILVSQVSGSAGGILNKSPQYTERILNLSGTIPRNRLLAAIRELSQLESDIRWAAHPRVLLEITLLTLCRPQDFAIASAEVRPGNDAMLQGKAMKSPGPNRKVEYAASGKSLQQAWPAANRDFGDEECKQAAQEKTEGTAESGHIDAAGNSLKAAEVRKGEEAAGRTVESRSTGKDKKEQTEKGQIQYLEEWQAILGELKAEGRLKLSMYLNGTRAVLLNDNQLAIVYDETVLNPAKVVNEPENTRILQDKVEKLLGKHMILRCMEIEEIESRTHEPEENAEDTDAIDKFKKMAEKLHVAFKVIDE